jgi:hypothetical protein
MRRKATILALAGAVGLFGAWIASSARAAGPSEWSMNATAIEACSCPMFCQCYFNTSPAGHHEHNGTEHFCRANLAYKINKGHYGAVSLDGVKFWLSNDLGPDFSKGQMDWNVLTLDKVSTADQQEAVKALVGYLFPVKWNSSNTVVGNIDHWEFDKDTAYASIDGGKTAEVKLKRFAGMTSDPVVIHNLRYWGAPRNDGFIMMPSEVEAYRVGPKAFEFKGTNGFMITVDMTSKDVAPKAN